MERILLKEYSGPPVDAHLAQVVHWLVVEPSAYHVKGCHGQHHHNTADQTSSQSHQPAVLWKNLKKKKEKHCA